MASGRGARGGRPCSGRSGSGSGSRWGQRHGRCSTSAAGYGRQWRAISHRRTNRWSVRRGARRARPTPMSSPPGKPRAVACGTLDTHAARANGQRFDAGLSTALIEDAARGSAGVTEQVILQHVGCRYPSRRPKAKRRSAPFARLHCDDVRSAQTTRERVARPGSLALASRDHHHRLTLVCRPAPAFGAAALPDTCRRESAPRDRP